MTPKAPKKNKKREEGMAMLVVMLVLLMVTATATFAAHSTSMDIRAAGHTRLAMQTHNLATASLQQMADYTERVTVDTLLRTMARTNEANVALSLAGVERTAQLAPGKEGARFYADDLAMSGGASPAPTGLFGPREVHAPQTLVDVYDSYKFRMPLAGHRADGLSPFSFVRLTFTARARARVRTAPGAESFVSQLETAADARAHVVAGPTFF